MDLDIQYWCVSFKLGESGRFIRKPLLAPLEESWRYAGSKLDVLLTAE